ncbi:MAG: type III pantothenate kinase [Bacteroidales bacterium]|jgi:type III pantothenate kinase|nr:type III pantothenate kinase [Bacteroidales bacterium]
MRLIIDNGNTRSKIAIFSGRTLIFVQAYEYLTFQDIELLLEKFPTIKKCIFSSVVKTNEETEKIKTFLKQNYAFVSTEDDLFLPIKNNYKTPKTLGKDRLAGIVGANNLFPYSHCLVIDAGSCITIDFIDKDGVYYGGSISLGINMKYLALNNFTDLLPLIKWQKENKSIIGDDTINSISSGVINGTILEVKGFIDYYKSLYEDIKIIFTGGDAQYLQSYFRENTILEENLVLSGLNVILDNNVKKN